MMLLHELGHALGHTSHSIYHRSVMYHVNTTTNAHGELLKSDYDELLYLYDEHYFGGY